MKQIADFLFRIPNEYFVLSYDRVKPWGCSIGHIYLKLSARNFILALAMKFHVIAIHYFVIEFRHNGKKWTNFMLVCLRKLNIKCFKSFLNKSEKGRRIKRRWRLNRRTSLHYQNEVFSWGLKRFLFINCCKDKHGKDLWNKTLRVLIKNPDVPAHIYWANTCSLPFATNRTQPL